MALERGDTSRLSDTEGGEKPVREKLQQAHITHDTSAPDTMVNNDSGEKMANSNEGLKVQPRGLLQKKRSYEEIEGEAVKDPVSAPAKHHTRKRSRDSTAEEDQLNNGRRKVSGERARNGDVAAEIDMDHKSGTDDASKTPPQIITPEPAAEGQTAPTVEEVASPKTKRSRLLSETPATETDNPVSNGSQASTQPTTQIPAGSGFANASATSPFGTLAGSKSPEPTTSASAFAASGFSALSGSSVSGFGSVAKGSSGFGSGGTFATGAKSALRSQGENEPPKAAGFGGTLSQSSLLSGAASSTPSAFGSGASGFGRLGSEGSGFGSALSGTGFGSLSGGGLSSFASGGKAPAPLGGSSKAAKSFGAPPVEDDDRSEDGGDVEDTTGMKSPLAVAEEKQDERFYKQSVETGEEDETIEFSSRAKLYNFTANAEGKKEWRERGLGFLRLNVKKLSDEDEKAKARLLMRADGSLRVVLNTPVMKDMKFGTPTGGPPQGGYMLFMGTIEGSSGLELLQVKMKQQNCLDLYDRVTELQESM